MPFLRPKPGSLCDTRTYKAGEAFTTNYTIFDWTIDSVIEANAGDSVISYNGIPLTFCDVTSIYAEGDLHSWSLDFSVILTCRQDDMFRFTARTSFSVTFLPGRYAGIGKRLNDSTDGIRDNIVYQMCVLSSCGHCS